MDTSHSSMEESSSAVSSGAENYFASASALSSSSLDLSRRGIAELPPQFPDCRRLERLYLEGNCLHTLPHNLCYSLPNLQWLDLRNNQLTDLPSSVDNLKSLRTLLLEGNCLTHLPPQLGSLSQLVGLNLCRNPLVSPPQQVVERGTKAVLYYLQQLSDTVAGAPPTEDSDEETEFTSPKREGPSCLSTEASPVLPSLSKGLPLHRPATLHSHSQELQHTKGRVGKQQGDSLSPTLPRSTQQRESKKLSWQQVECLGASGGKAKVLGEASSRSGSQQLTAAEQSEISTALEQQRSKDYLEKWRQETRRLQRQSRPSQQGSVAATAPYATDSTSPASGREASISRGQHEARETEVSEKMHRYMVSLREQRQPSGRMEELSELLEAERRLEETMAERKALESRKTREYRLTAFTGDLPMGTL